LPPDVADFAGRETETSLLVDLVTRGVGQAPLSRSSSSVAPVFAVYGQGGVGKTALLVHVGHISREWFRDGQLFINLRGEDGSPLGSFEVLGRFLRPLGLEEPDIPVDVGERI
jgi:hypothetical protein